MKAAARFFVVFRHASDNAFYERAIEMNGLVGQRRIFTCRDQGIFCGSGVALGQCTNQPTIGDTLRSGGICGPD